MTIYLASQLLAALAFGFALYGFMHGQDKSLKLLIGASAVAMALHFALLGAWAGMAISLIAACRYIVSSYTKNVWLMALFMALGVIYGAFTHQIWSDALPVLSNILATFAIFNLTRARLRGCLIVVSLCWVAYNGLHGSIVGMASECFYILANIYNIHKNTRKPVAYKA